jgi:hypothetical protein
MLPSYWPQFADIPRNSVNSTPLAELQEVKESAKLTDLVQFNILSVLRAVINDYL